MPERKLSNTQWSTSSSFIIQLYSWHWWDAAVLDVVLVYQCNTNIKALQLQINTKEWHVNWGTGTPKTETKIISYLAG